MDNLPQDFNWRNYLTLNIDLMFTTEEECKKHFLHHGIFENRIYTFNIPQDFNWKTYIDMHSDLKHLKINEFNLIRYISRKKCPSMHN
jgi:hypothetical protein